MRKPQAETIVLKQPCNGLAVTSGKFPHSPIAQVFKAGVETWFDCRKSGIQLPESLAIVHNALQREQLHQRQRLALWMNSLRLVSSVAPLLGMAGMTYSIWQKLFMPSHGDSACGYMESIYGIFSEGLIFALFGLAVGVPAWWLFCHFTETSEQLFHEMETCAEDLMVFFRQQSR
ncbi:MAG: MotA/TolQ/ExbB proton channel family protein [Blastocatellia bacterium]|nr:MotA/TolQ/ExbB proton channel family protein [Blastocatellia bacterium]